MPASLIPVSAALAVAGFALLGLGMARHQRDALGRALAGRWTIGLRAGGWGLLVLSLILCFGSHRPGLEVVAWLGVLTVAAVAVAAVLSFAPRLLPGLGGAALLLATLLALGG